MSTGKVDALLGIVFGDEGKGKVVDVGTPEEVFVPHKIRQLFGIDTKVTVNEATGKPNIIFIPDLVS